MSLALFLLAQVGPLVSPGAAPALQLPPAIETNRPPRRASTPAAPLLPPALVQNRLSACLDETARDGEAALELASAWLVQAKGSAQAEPQLCVGTALSAMERWDEAERAFLAGRDSAAASDHGLRARLGGMAGNAAMVQGASDRGLAAFDTAHADALADGDTGLGGEIALDRARALVSLKREGEAETALAQARAARPDNALVWLLSATLSRRMNRLTDAQSQIEKAAALFPSDPAIGLEAGLIAMLAGREDAARKSWQSVVTTGPDSAEAKTARDYLGQLGPAPTTPAPTPPKAAPPKAAKP